MAFLFKLLPQVLRMAPSESNSRVTGAALPDFDPDSTERLPKMVFDLGDGTDTTMAMVEFRHPSILIQYSEIQISHAMISRDAKTVLHQPAPYATRGEAWQDM